MRGKTVSGLADRVPHLAKDAATLLAGEEAEIVTPSLMNCLRAVDRRSRFIGVALGATLT